MDKNDAKALEHLLISQPTWVDIQSASDAIGLQDRVLLHSGPPVTSEHVTPTLNSAAVACVFEGWARTLEEADELISSGGIRFEPAQDHNAATPLAAVISPSMQVLVMEDLVGPGRRAVSPLNGGGTGAAPAGRYGRKSNEAIELLYFLNDSVAPAIAPAIKDPVPWLPIIDEALSNGDDAHLRHQEAHKTLVALFDERLGFNFTESKVGTFVSEWPIFHLNFWMAAARCALSAASGVEGSSLVTASGGNGKDFGLKVSGLPKIWFTSKASVPIGNVRPPHTLSTCTGAYGDSALSEIFGLGAMAMSYCPDMQELHSGFYEENIYLLPEKLLMSTHPAMPSSKAIVGLSARAVVKHGEVPIIELGLVDKAGKHGGLGAGIFRPPLDPFLEACLALNNT